MKPITINAIMTAKPGMEDDLFQEMQKMVAPSRAEKGCEEYTLHQSVEQEGVFVFYETWQDEQALKEHVATKHYLNYRRKIESLVEKREVYRLTKV
ncbi:MULTISPECIES: putative quinol monooxygenase [Bacillaceae]|uniref:putative quinol monooxygenase n=1 Tax=Bacillaceae TaxID=186817 RepID=UPI0001E896D5|nr:putative quinol monooxygenase [Bacillus sp. m3-13]